MAMGDRRAVYVPELGAPPGTKQQPQDRTLFGIKNHSHTEAGNRYSDMNEEDIFTIRANYRYYYSKNPDGTVKKIQRFKFPPQEVVSDEEKARRIAHIRKEFDEYYFTREPENLDPDVAYTDGWKEFNQKSLNLSFKYPPEWKDPFFSPEVNSSKIYYISMFLDLGDFRGVEFSAYSLGVEETLWELADNYERSTDGGMLMLRVSIDEQEAHQKYNSFGRTCGRLYYVFPSEANRTYVASVILCDDDSDELSTDKMEIVKSVRFTN